MKAHQLLNIILMKVGKADFAFFAGKPLYVPM